MQIPLYDRKLERETKEIVFEEGFMTFFYQNPFGRLLCDLVIKKKWFSRLYGVLQRSKRSRSKISEFISKYQIDTNEVKEPISQFNSFNDFFIRELKPSARPFSKNPKDLISPADSRLLACELQESLIVPIKGREVSVIDLIGKKFNHQEFLNGYCAIFRLAPSDHHHFCFIDDGTQSKVEIIEGDLHSVSPFALQNDVRVFDGNYREIALLDTVNFKKVMHVDVGALVVGLIHQSMPEGGKMERGSKKGYFEFGASSIVLLFEPDTVEFDQSILEYSQKGIESKIQMGETIGNSLVDQDLKKNSTLAIKIGARKNTKPQT